MLLLHPFYCTFIMYPAIRLSSRKCAINSVFSVYYCVFSDGKQCVNVGPRNCKKPRQTITSFFPFVPFPSLAFSIPLPVFFPKIHARGPGERRKLPQRPPKTDYDASIRVSKRTSWQHLSASPRNLSAFCIRRNANGAMAKIIEP